MKSLQEVSIATWQNHKAKPMEVIRPEKFSEDETLKEAAQGAVRVARRAPIKIADPEKYGFPDHCPKCTHIRKYGHNRGQGGEHSSQCRERIYAELIKTDEGK